MRCICLLNFNCVWIDPKLWHILCNMLLALIFSYNSTLAASQSLMNVAASCTSCIIPTTSSCTFPVIFIVKGELNSSHGQCAKTFCLKAFPSNKLNMSDCVMAKEGSVATALMIVLMIRKCFTEISCVTWKQRWHWLYALILSFVCHFSGFAIWWIPCCIKQNL